MVSGDSQDSSPQAYAPKLWMIQHGHPAWTSYAYLTGTALYCLMGSKAGSDSRSIASTLEALGPIPPDRVAQAIRDLQGVRNMAAKGIATENVGIPLGQITGATLSKWDGRLLIAYLDNSGVSRVCGYGFFGLRDPSDAISNAAHAKTLSDELRRVIAPNAPIEEIAASTWDRIATPVGYLCLAAFLGLFLLLQYDEILDSSQYFLFAGVIKNTMAALGRGGILAVFGTASVAALVWLRRRYATKLINLTWRRPDS